ncbi:hypothetical protein VHEMI06782 [[Torrubiella] hemipterigena]|uniref:Uncharacterized protein n=1 Tax=[Torrubiella] hemipterigena TaxID=1531966 RepID=A0A0A1TLQ3_9HYPO|nr:hypothetical protein VHEMI06782 [[Torrubiella] hemipterigena]
MRAATTCQKFYPDPDEETVILRMFIGTSGKANQVLYSAFRHPQYQKGVDTGSKHYLALALPGGELKDGSLSIGELGIIGRWVSLFMRSALEQDYKAASITLISIWELWTINNPQVQTLLRWAMGKPYGDLKKYELGKDGPSLFHVKPRFALQSAVRKPVKIGQEPKLDYTDESEADTG